VRAGQRQPAGPHLHQGAAARAAAARDGAAAAPDAPGRLGEGLLRRRAGEPGHLGRCRALRAGGQLMTAHVWAAAVLAAGGAMTTGEKVSFWVLGILALGCAIAMVAAKNAVHSALFLVVTMFCLGVFYIIEAGPFIGMAQIIVYTGAVMMLFLFVLMLVG